MYKKFYGFNEKPFHLIANPKFLYLSKKHQNALTYLEYGLSEGSGFILLTGDIGAGKTTIIRHILNRIENNIEVAVISNTNVNSGELIELVLHEFGVESAYDNKAKSLDAVFHYLIKKFSQGKRVLLVIDEAQNLSDQALEEVRMLSNLQTDDQMLLQIILVGQPELKKRLQSKSLTQLSQRIAVNYHLGPLEYDEIRAYIAFRLEKAGGSLEVFEDNTFELIYQGSGGIPRIINSICDTALVYGYAESLPHINMEVITQVICDKEGLGLMPNEQIADEQSITGQRTGDDTLTPRLLILEEKVASLQQQIDSQLAEDGRYASETNDRLVAELTAMLRNEREKTDRLLLEYCLLKAGVEVNADKENRVDRVTSIARGLAEMHSPAPGSPQTLGGGEDVRQHKDTGENTNGLFHRISSPEISMIDIHCHILPEIDDGPNTFDDSVAMARLAAADGIYVIVATPHLNEKLYSPSEISRRVSWLNHLLRKDKIPVTTMHGADVSVRFRPDQVQGFTINDSEYILVEFDHTHLPKNADEILDQFVISGYRPIITHPERNPSIIASPQLLLDLLDKNIHVQVTAGSLTGDFGIEAQQCAQHLLRAGVVDVIATDAHSTMHRKPLLSLGVKAAAEIVGSEAAQRMVFSTPAKIISGLSF